MLLYTGSLKNVSEMLQILKSNSLKIVIGEVHRNMKKRLACLSLIFAMAATQVLPVSAARKDDVQAQKSETQNKLSEAEARAIREISIHF